MRKKKTMRDTLIVPLILEILSATSRRGCLVTAR